ncbi:MAG: hypothetical protein Q9170_003593 [Blastenia crenularia]
MSDPDTEDIKTSLKGLLSSVEAHGSFATSGRVPGDVATGLTVTDVGRVALPLLESQAKEITRLCHQAPFGHRDESSRKTWELNPDQCELCNPAWPSTLDQITKKAANELGCAPETKIKANLYKLLLYEESALFKPHKDTEREPGMIGTLVICLPSIYTGGIVVATHRGQSKVLEAESPSLFHSYNAWFTDVTHEVKPVASGYRFVLTYNLVNASRGPTPSASLNISSTRKLQATLRSWKRNIDQSDFPGALIYLLDHKYANADLRLQALKGLDRVRAEYLREVCAAASVCFYLACMEYSEYGGAEEDGYRCYRSGGVKSRKCHALEDVVVKRILLKQMVDLNGRVLGQDIKVNDDSIVQNEPFARDPDEEDYEGWTGNEGASATHWYRDTVSGTHTLFRGQGVMVLMPLSHRRIFLGPDLQAGRVDADAWIQRLIKHVHGHPADGFCKDDLRELSRSIIRSQRDTKDYLHRQQHVLDKKDLYQPPESSLLIRASAVLRDRMLFEQVVDTFHELTSQRTLHEVGKFMVAFDIPLDHPILNRLVERIKSDYLQTFTGRLTAIRHIKEGFERRILRESSPNMAKLDSVRAWASAKCKDVVGTLNSVVRNDGCLVIARQHNSNTAFLVALTTKIFSFTEDDNHKSAEIDTAMTELAELLSNNFTIECRNFSKRESPGSSGNQNAIECLLDSDDVDLLLHQLRRDYSATSWPLIIQKISRERSRCQSFAFKAFYIPLLDKLTYRIARDPQLLPIYRPFFQRILSAYIRRYVSVQPPSGGWARPRPRCHLQSCSDCSVLGDFLVDSERQTMSFLVPSSRRAHLHQVLTGTGNSHETDRSRGDALVVTKEVSDTDKKYHEWQIRFQNAREKIMKLNQEVLKELLGENYDNITKLRATKRMAGDVDLV